MAAAPSEVELFSNCDICQWQAALLCYEEVVALKAAEKSKKNARSASKGGETLVELDVWYQETLPELISLRDSPHLTHEELAKVMKWKLTRGKFRPRLAEMVKQNSREEVESVTKEALAALPNLSEAMTHLTKLKAVGPATASAIMCAAAPEVAPFMADESVLSVPNLGKLDYTQKHYLAYAGKVQEKAKELSKLDTYRKWSAHDVELALWSFHFAKKLHPDLLKTTNSEENDEPRGKKRTSEDTGSDIEGREEESSFRTRKSRKC